MDRFFPTCVAVISIFLLSELSRADEPKSEPSSPEAIQVSEKDWPWWRGFHRNGIAPSDQKPPVRWSETENVLWKATLPGRGHGSPTVIGDRVFLAAADGDSEVQSVLCFDRRTGKSLWQAEVHRGGFEKKGNVKSSLASSSVAGDGRNVYVNFLHAGAINTTALDLAGKIVWQTKVADYVLHQGFGSSPAVYESLVLVSADNKGGGLIAGLHRGTGKVVWQQERPKLPNYTSPIILKVNGRDQLLFAGCDLVVGFEPLTGKKLWEVAGSTTECVTSIVSDGRLVFTSGGYPKNHMSAIHGDTTGKVEWENNVRVYVPSMIVRDGTLYAVTDAGVAMCWDCATGKEQWKQRLGGTFSASPVLVGDQIFATNEAGTTFIFGARSDKFESIGENTLGTDVFASPAICGNRIYMRVAIQVNGQRQEMLYCLGSAPIGASDNALPRR